MSVALAQEPSLVHSVPGRVRVHLPALTPQNRRELENALRHQPGIDSVQANPDTGNVLIRFAPGSLDGPAVLRLASSALAAPDEHRNGSSPSSQCEKPLRLPRPPWKNGKGRRGGRASLCVVWTATPRPRGASWSGWSRFQASRRGRAC